MIFKPLNGLYRIWYIVPFISVFLLMILVTTEIYPVYSFEGNYLSPHIVSFGTLAVGIIMAYFFRAKQKFSRNILFLSIALSLVVAFSAAPAYLGQSLFQYFLVALASPLPIAVYAVVARSYKGLYKHPNLTIFLGLIILYFSVYLLWILRPPVFPGLT